MSNLNYRHLQYFAAVVRKGSVTAAAKSLHVTQPTVSEQIKQLEADLGEPLFRREGRSLVLTTAGRTAYHYAEQIFGLGAELTEAVANHRTGHGRRLTAGVSDVVPKLIALHVLEPVMALQPVVSLTCHQDRPEMLMAELGLGELDLVIADAPIRSGTPVRAFSEFLGESGMTCFATPDHAEAYRTGFPHSLDGSPVLLPSVGTMLRASIERWFDDHDLMPLVVAEFDDSAQLKAFGQAGSGAFFAPTVIEEEVAKDYYVEPVGRVAEVRERAYAIWSERSADHPGVLAVLEHGHDIFDAIY